MVSKTVVVPSSYNFILTPLIGLPSVSVTVPVISANSITEIYFVSVSVSPELSVTVNDTVYVPPEEY